MESAVPKMNFAPRNGVDIMNVGIMNELYKTNVSLPDKNKFIII